MNKKICIVDDDSAIREIYSSKFAAGGYDVVTANDGEKGFELIKKEHPDIILLDLLMPNMDGMSLLEKIRKDSEISRIPVVVMTNLDDSDIIKKAGVFDAKFYVVKSLFTPQKVFGLVEEVLS